jgi:hypothetical protein
MTGNRRVIVFFEGPEEEARAREALGAGAQWFNGVAQGTAGSEAVATLMTAGLTVEVIDAVGEGIDPPVDWLGTGLPAPRVVPPSAGGASAEPRVTSQGRGGPRWRVYVGALIGGLTAGAGALVLLQQASLIDPTPLIGLAGLTLGALGGIVPVVLLGRRGS